jgi:transcriptional regulator with XRE-family HTH domain
MAIRSDQDVLDRFDWQGAKTSVVVRKNIGNEFKRRRKATGSTQEDFVTRAGKGKLPGVDDEIGIHIKDVQRLEQGRLDELSLDRFVKLVRCLNLSLDEFLRTAGHPVDLSSPPKNAKSSADYLAYLEQEAAAMLNQPLIHWDARSGANLKFIWPDLVVAGPMEAKRSHTQLDLREWSKMLTANANAALIGAPGTGKSTALRFLFLTLKDSFASKGAGRSPFYAHLADLVRADGTLTALSRLAATQSAPVFLLDGLDEVSLDLVEKFINNDLPSLAKLGNFILACRYEIFYREFSNAPALSRYLTEVYELAPWDVERHSLSYCRDYFKKAGQADLIPAFEALFAKAPDARAFAKNPFQLSLLIFLAMSGETGAVSSIHNRYMLYIAFYRHWLARESKRSRDSRKGDDVAAMHTSLAFEYYTCRSNNVRFSELESWREVSHDLLSSTAFRDLLVERLDLLHYENYVAGFRHESLVEFFIARRLMNALLAGPAQASEVLDVEYNYEINSFVRDAFSVCPKGEKDNIERHLAQLYETLLAKSVAGDGAPGWKSGTGDGPSAEADSNLRIREQAVYFLGRLNMEKCPSVLEAAFHKDREPIIRRAAALGATLHFNLSIECQYMESLQPGNEEDHLNRSVQLVYFGDTPGSLHSFRDPGHTPWEKTKRAIVQRLAGDSTRDVRLRWWDLWTLHSFLISRGDRLSQAECAVVANSANLFGEPEPRRSSIKALAAAIVDQHSDLA